MCWCMLEGAEYLHKEYRDGGGVGGQGPPLIFTPKKGQP